MGHDIYRKFIKAIPCIFNNPLIINIFVKLFEKHLDDLNRMSSATIEALQALIAKYGNQSFIRDIISDYPDILLLFQKQVLVSQQLPLLDISNNIRDRDMVKEYIDNMLKLSILSNEIDKIFDQYCETHAELEPVITDYLAESKFYHIRGALANMDSFIALENFLYSI